MLSQCFVVNNHEENKSSFHYDEDLEDVFCGRSDGANC
jgi:hypothetical protein